jgi:Holliday junction resolvase RusA-like endonuclease
MNYPECVIREDEIALLESSGPRLGRSIVIEYYGEVRPLARMTRYTRYRGTPQGFAANRSYQSIEDARLVLAAAMSESGILPFAAKVPITVTGEIRIPRARFWTGDIDNFIKAIFDSGQHARGRQPEPAILWHDDRYITDIRFRKVAVNSPDESGFSLVIYESPAVAVPAVAVARKRRAA